MGQIVAISRAVQPANKFFGTDWHARFWVRCSNLTAKAHVILFFEDTDGNFHPSIENNVGTGTITSTGTTATGVATLFTTELQVGDLILALDQVRRVVTITNDLSLEVDVAFSPDLTAEGFTYQKYTILDPSIAPLAAENAVVVQTTARDFGRFEAVDVKLLFNDVDEDDVIDIGVPFLTNEISQSLHVGDNTIPRNKQREYKMYRMAVANPDVFTEVEAGIVGSNFRIDSEPVVLTESEFVPLANRNLFPFSEVVARAGIKSQGTIQYSDQPTDGDTITIGVNIFEFDNDAVVGSGNVLVTIGATAEDTFQSLVDAINTLSPLATATHTSAKHTVLVQALLVGASGNGIVFAQDCSVVKLTPIIGTLDGGVDGADFVRGIDYKMRYEEGEIARLPKGSIPQPSPSDLVVTYSYFPGDVPLNTSYSQTIKPVGVKLEIDPTCLFFFRGRMHDFTDPEAINVNFDAVERTPSRFSYLRPTAPGRHAQVVQFSASIPHNATLDYAAMVDEEAVLVKTTVNGGTIAIPFDATNGWFFVDDTTIRLTTGTAFLTNGESALFDADAEYEFVYFVKFQFTTAAISIADFSSAYALVPYVYKARQIEETKEDVQQVLFLNTSRQATLTLTAIDDQSLAELTRTLGGVSEILSDDQWQFVDETTVEVFLASFDPAAIYELTYKSAKVSHDPIDINEVYEIAVSDDGFTFDPFETFVPGDVRLLAPYVKFRLTTFGDFDTDDYRVRGFSGISDDATLVEGGFGLSPFGRFPFGDGGVCFDDENISHREGTMDLSGALDLVISATPPTMKSLSGTETLSGELDILSMKSLSGSAALSGALAIQVIAQEEGSLAMSGGLVAKASSSEDGSMAMSGALEVMVSESEAGSTSMSGALVLEPLLSESGAMAASGALAVDVLTTESGAMAASGGLTPTFVSADSVHVAMGTNGPASQTPTSTNIYFDFGFIGTPTATLINAQRRLPVAITANDLQGELTAALAAGQSAAVRLNVGGSGNNTLLMSFGTASAPTPAQVPTASGNLTNGAYRYKTTWVINGYENPPSGASASVTVDGTHKQVSLSAIATGPTGTTARKVYRTISGGATYFLLTTINDNSTTTFTDNIADGSLGAAQVTSLRVGASPGQIDMAVDDLICFEALSFVGATQFTLGYMMMPYSSKTGFGFIRARSQFASISNPWTSVTGTTTGAGASATGVTAWLTKPITILEGTLAADVAPGGATAVKLQIKKNDGVTNVGSQISLSGANTSVRTTVSAALPATTTGAAADNNAANLTQTGSPAAGNVRDAFSYIADSPNGKHAFYCTGRQGFNHTIGATAVFPPIDGWNTAGAFSGTEASEDVAWPIAGTFKFLGANSQVDVGTTVTLTLRVNGVDSALVLTHAGTGAVQWQSDLSTTVHVNAGDLVNYKALRTAGAGGTYTLNAVIFFVAD